MKAKGSRVCSEAIVLFVFVCLLLAGAGRLIASEGDGQAHARPEPKAGVALRRA